jgi:hypothetical protein
MKTNVFLAGWVLTMAALGCGSVTGIPIEKTATEYSQAICTKAYACCTAAQLMNNKSAGTSEPECEASTADDFRRQLQQRQEAENAGRAKYDQAKVDACLAAIRAATCAELTTIRSLAGIPACDSTFVTPLVEIGGKCQQDFECIGGVCQKGPGAFDGVCAAGVAAGASCATDHCAQDLICDGHGSDDRSDDLCVAEQDDGAACNDAFDCKSRNCVAAAAGGAKTCTAPASQCFYGGGCSAGGRRPGLAALLVMIVFAVVPFSRARGAQRPRR